MGGIDELKRKLNDSYTEETYNSKEVQENLESNLTNIKDFLGRDFTYSIDETNWPDYLKENKAMFKHLCL